MKIEELGFLVIGNSGLEYEKFIDSLGANNIFLKSRFIYTMGKAFRNIFDLYGIDDIKFDYIIMLSQIDEDVVKWSYAFEDAYRTILYLEKPDDAICSINIGDTTLYIKRPSNGILNDSIFRADGISYELEPDIHMIRAASVPDIPNINGIIYTKESIVDALMSDRFKELIHANMMNVEFGSSRDKQQPIARFQTIEPIYVVGEVKAVGDRFLFIKSNDTFIEVFKENNDSELVGFMRYFSELLKTDEKKPHIAEKIRIITWDIWHASELPLLYLESLK